MPPSVIKICFKEKGFPWDHTNLNRFIYMKNMVVALCICYKIVVTIIIVIKCAINFQCDCSFIWVLKWALLIWELKWILICFVLFFFTWKTIFLWFDIRTILLLKKSYKTILRETLSPRKYWDLQLRLLPRGVL